jgi:excisionase family DNA binding protein
MENLLSTKEVAEFLGVNEKMVYTLISEKGLPATKITGKWLFPKNLVEQWVANMTINYPRQPESAVEVPNLLLIAGSNDILLDNTMALFRRTHPEFVAFFGNLGSLGGLKALKQGLCHVATSHLSEEGDKDYNFSYAASLLNEFPAIVNFCCREQGLLVAKGNPHKIQCVADVVDKRLSVANRPLEASTRLLFDREFKKAERELGLAGISGTIRRSPARIEPSTWSWGSTGRLSCHTASTPASTANRSSMSSVPSRGRKSKARVQLLTPSPAW